MIRPISPATANERLIAAGAEPREYRGGIFTCRHWDPETRLCGIYEDRPAMCRDYPYGAECAHGCSCEGNTAA